MPTAATTQAIALLNSWGARFTEIAGSMLLQSMTVAILLLAATWACSRARAAFRYGLLILILIKLLLPPSLSLPTGWAYWIQQPTKPAEGKTHSSTAIKDGGEAVQSINVSTASLSAEALIFLTWLAGICALSAFVLRRYRKVSVLANTSAAVDLQQEVDACRAQIGVRQVLRVQTSTDCISPAVCGLFSPVIVIPKLLAEKLTPAQLRHVLLHEVAHVRRGDLWINHLQVALQVIHWFNPVVWLANRVIRHVREEAVDDLVMAKLGADRMSYPTTLVAVAKMAFAKPQLALGFIGIMVAKASLKRRVSRLVQNPVSPAAKLGWVRSGVLVATAAVLLPMARPKAMDKPTEPEQQLTKPRSREAAESAQIDKTSKLISLDSIPNGARQVTFEGNVTVWDVKTGRMLQSFLNGTNLIYSAAFSPDGRLLISGSTIRVWDLPTGRQISSVKGHSNVITQVTFSPDGKRLITSNGTETNVWELFPFKPRVTTNSPTEPMKDRSPAAPTP